MVHTDRFCLFLIRVWPSASVRPCGMLHNGPRARADGGPAQPLFPLLGGLHGAGLSHTPTMQRCSSMPRDVNQLAHKIGRIAIGQEPDRLGILGQLAFLPCSNKTKSRPHQGPVFSSQQI